MATEQRLIDAGRRERILQRFAGHLLEAGKTEAAEAVNTLIKALKLEPTVDAVEVVRCKDCTKQYTPDCIMSDGLGEAGDSDFCSYGERKEQ